MAGFCSPRAAVVTGTRIIPLRLSGVACSAARLVVIPAGCFGPPVAFPGAALTGAAAPMSSENFCCATCAPLPLLSDALLLTAGGGAAAAEPLAWADGAGRPSMDVGLEPATTTMHVLA